MTIENGDKVQVDYKGTLEDGTVFDDSAKHGKPLEFEIGSGQIIPGFEKAVKEMKEGESKKITLPPAEAYGDPNPQLTQKIPKDKVPTDQKVEAGMMLMLSLPNGQQVPARIVEVGEKEFTVDLNHPLAGKTLTFELKLVKIIKKA